MRKLVVSEFMTLDGVIQAPGGNDEDRDGGFEHGGWTWPYRHDDIGAAFGAMMADTDAFLLGRKTYLIHGNAFEPMPEGLVDELHLLVYPLFLGSGKRLFPNGVRQGFTLVSSKPYPSGVAGLHYVRAR